jgi:hypothetical protein
VRHLSCVVTIQLIDALRVHDRYPYGKPVSPKEDETQNKLSNYDQILCFVEGMCIRRSACSSHTKWYYVCCFVGNPYTKKEVLSLLRTMMSVHTHNKDSYNFAVTLKNRLFVVKNTEDALATTRYISSLW